MQYVQHGKTTNRNGFSLVWLIPLLFALGCSSNGGGSNDSSSNSSDTDSDTDSDAGSDADSDGDSDSDTDSDTDTDSDSDSDTDSDTDTDSDADGDGDTDVDSDSDGDTDGDSDTETDDKFSEDTDPMGPADVLAEFPMDKVVINNDYINSLFDAELAYLMSLEPDKLMAAVKAVSEGTDPDKTRLDTYGGWEASGSGFHLRSHSLGHWLSAISRAYLQLHNEDETRAKEVKDKLDYTIDQLKSFQDKSSNRFIYGSFETHFDSVEGKNNVTTYVPWYTMHKLLQGILDAYIYGGNETALEVADKLGDWVHGRVSKWDENLRRSVLATEYGGMNDVLYELYQVTEKNEHLAAAKVFDEDWSNSLFDSISQGRNVLPGKHANTQIPKVVGAIKRYRTLGKDDDFYRTTAEQFFEIVLRDHTYVTGGNSQDEHFREPGRLNAQRDNTNNETCNSHNMLKLTRNLFMVTGDIKYANYYEKNFINEILASINPETGMTTYFKPMATGGFKMFGTPTNSFWCCTGTGMENFMKLDNSLYFHDAKDLWINNYISSTVDWTNRNLKLTTLADLPMDDTVRIIINRAPKNNLKIKFRKPYWVDNCEPTVVKVNGKACDAIEADGYIEVERVWRTDDTVEISFPMKVGVSRLPDNENAVAFTYGPVVLSAGFGTENMVLEGHKASGKPTMIPVDDSIAIKGATINEWIGNIKDNLVQSAGTLEFKLKNTDADDRLTFSPHYLRYKDRYGIYFELEGQNGGNVPDENCSAASDEGVECNSVSASSKSVWQ
ncbi:MAG: glycoside hydrolase family 127 protein [Deltaproteobacteria bacterium]|nr:glycoside hydrolase family 127 protein [Deltaproteobacteria bacterium]